MPEVKRLFIIDAMAMAFRSFYAFSMGRPLTSPTGLPISAVFGSALFMNKLLKDTRPDYLAIACDSREPTFRHKLYDAYKANRTEMPEDLAAQLPQFFRLLSAYGCPVLRQPGLEADDLIGSLARRFGGENLHVYIVSGDKDFMQLVNDHTYIYTPKKGDDAVIIKREGVLAKFGVTPEQVIDCLAIIGDTSDNVPGVHGIGEKGAAKLISEHGSLAGIYANLDAITNKKHRECLEKARDMAFLSRELVSIKTDVEMADIALENLACDPEAALRRPELYDLFQELEFKGLLSKMAPPSPTIASSSTGSSGSVVLSEAKNLVLPAPAPRIVDAPPAAKAPEKVSGYKLANTRADVDAVVAALLRSGEFSFDTETTGLSIVDDRPIGISVSTTPNEAYYVPLVAKHLTDITPPEVLQKLAPILSSEGRFKIGHNVKFDIQMLANLGIEVKGPFIDTMICDWLLDAGGRQHGLDACCLRHLGYEKIPTSSLIGQKGELPMLDADLQELSRYACEDADFTLRLYHHLMPRIVEAGLGNVLREIEMPLVPILAKMERAGVFIDKDDLARQSRTLNDMAMKLEAKIHDLAGESFNINSPKQLSDILFTKMKVHEGLGVKHLKKTKTGFSTDESVLQRLSSHPLANAILEFRTVAKLKGTYVDQLPTLINRHTGRVHTSFHQTGTATGRLSSSDPNLQNIPIRSPLGQEIRKAFKSKGEGDWVMISADYSQIELRVLAHMAGEKALAQAFAEGRDIHRWTAAKVFGVEPDAVDDSMRSRAKAINFGIIYGMGARRLAAETGTTLAEATAFIDRYFAGYPGIGKFVDETVAEARATGVTRTVTGRRRSVPGLDGSSQRGIAMAENVAVNTRIQGSAADLIKLAMIAIDKRLKEEGLKTRMLLQVHDELIFECPRAETERATALIKQCMESAMQLTVPLAVQAKAGHNWLEAH